MSERIVAVSGAGSGFGRAIAAAFISDGARVFGCDVDNAGLAAAQACGVETASVDLSDRSAAREWISDIVANTGRIDVLVNNAGGVLGQAHRPFPEVEDADWDAVFAINVHAAAALSQAAVARMALAGGGAIVNIASGASLKASLTGVQAYCAAKHAMLGLTRQLAQEFGTAGIRVNAVAPGFVITNEATQAQWRGYGEAGQAALIGRTALRRLGRPEDIAQAVLFLSSEAAGFITGQILSVDGGQ